MSLSESSEVWRSMKNDFLRVDVMDNLKLVVSYTDGGSWTTRGAEPGDFTAHVAEEYVSLDVTAPRRRAASEFYDGRHKGYVFQLGQFPNADVELDIFVGLDEFGDEVCVEVFQRRGEDHLCRVRYPYPFLCSGNGGSYTLFPQSAGAIVPWNFPRELHAGQLVWGSETMMPFWGMVSRDRALLAVIDTPCDARMNLDHPAGGPTSVILTWEPELGRLGYRRRLFLHFVKGMGYVELCKLYREYAKAAGRFRTLEEKMVEMPLLRRYVRAIRFDYSANYGPLPSQPYKGKTIPVFGKDPEGFFYPGTYREALEDFRQWREHGFEGVAYGNLWGGNNLTPDGVFRPNEEAGGFDEARRLAEQLKRLDFIVEVYQIFHDYNYDCATYNPDKAIKKEDESVPHADWFDYGPGTFLNPYFSREYLARNLDHFERMGLHIDSIYQDGYAIRPMDESFDPIHPMTRRECLSRRISSLLYSRSRGLITGSEWPCDWSIPYCDFYAWLPYAGSWYGDGKPFGIPVPLFPLVYHECYIVRYPVVPRGTEAPVTALYALLYGTIPNAWNPPWDRGLWSMERQALADWLSVWSRLYSATATSEMTNHELLDSKGKKQRVTYSNGVTVSVDFEALKFRVTGLEGFSGNWENLPEYCYHRPWSGDPTGIVLADRAAYGVDISILNEKAGTNINRDWRLNTHGHLRCHRIHLEEDGSVSYCMTLEPARWGFRNLEMYLRGREGGEKVDLAIQSTDGKTRDYNLTQVSGPLHADRWIRIEIPLPKDEGSHWTITALTFRTPVTPATFFLNDVRFLT